MGLIDKIFGSSKGVSDKKEEKILPWIALDALEQLDIIQEKSKIKTQVIFKHSTRCGISRMVMSQFVESYGFSEQDLDLYYLDLLNFREVSNEVGYRFQVVHESPQILVIKNGEVVEYASHGQINEVDLVKFI
ncbi:cytosolic protein [Pseudalgibacter alginicilyticus]|uniref:Cytosolic protein n=1 Tax=Pseudalgibacter alginicilyticus TaxID=1736674 RepID=A0A0P0D8W0_9FLAO|nr:bacillithiol system redox-active protein YtxJ [Pseudalgibacter alginicilyticus]ALJ04300.1 cytosolic protein [Pseudalgibacter alginicilyticus]